MTYNAFFIWLIVGTCYLTIKKTRWDMDVVRHSKTIYNSIWKSVVGYVMDTVTHCCGVVIRSLAIPIWPANDGSSKAGSVPDAEVNFY